MPSNPEEREELAAGYVLGDLSSEETEQFQQWLTQDPALRKRVAELQETLGMMAYGLVEEPAPAALRSRITAAAQDRLSAKHSQTQESNIQLALAHPSRQKPPQQEFPQQKPIRRFAARWEWWGSLAALVAIALGLQKIGLQRTVFQPQVLSPSDPQAESIETLTVEAPSNFWVNHWRGIRYLHADHQQSLVHPQGVVEVTAKEKKRLSDQLRRHLGDEAPLANLSSAKAKFLGLTPCQIEKSKGLRMTYQVEQETVSLYQLQRAETSAFPEPGAELVTLKGADGLGMVLWEKDTFFYALVSELPVAQLKQLAQSQLSQQS